jgi:predicted TIM-barrel fold metal-dependent hydrolase
MLPPGSWDCHFHVLGPQQQFPYSPTRKYTPPSAPFEKCVEFHRSLGIQRGFVVHANTHGFANEVDLDAAERSEGRYVAVVRLNDSVTSKECERLHLSGARGVRFAFNPQHGGTLDLAVFQHVLDCIKPLNWFVELHFDGGALPGLEEWLRSIPTVVVIDHFGRIDPHHGVDQVPFRILKELMRRDNVWMKFSGAERISRTGPPYKDVVPFAHQLLQLTSDRIVWGSDWPHTGVFEPSKMPDDGKLLDALLEFVPDERLRHKILVNNPRKLAGDEPVLVPKSVSQ